MECGTTLRILRIQELLSAAATDEGKLITNFPEDSSSGRGCSMIVTLLLWLPRSESEMGEQLIGVLPAAKQNCVVRKMMIDDELC